MVGISEERLPDLLTFVIRWDYSELVNTRNARYRTFMMLLMGFFGQWSGNGLG